MKTVGQTLLGILVLLTPIGIVYLITKSETGDRCLERLSEWLDS